MCLMVVVKVDGGGLVLKIEIRKLLEELRTTDLSESREPKQHQINPSSDEASAVLCCSSLECFVCLSVALSALLMVLFTLLIEIIFFVIANSTLRIGEGFSKLI